MSGNEESIEQSWEQQPGENNAWYQRFSEYLRLGAGRSVRAVYNAEHCNEVSKAVPASWTQASHRYEWQRRAAEYDAWRRAAVFQAGNASDTERIKKLGDLMEHMHRRLIDGLGSMEINEKFIERYLAVVDLLAKHTGGYAPQRIEHTGKDGKAIEIEGDAAALQVFVYLPDIDPLPEISPASDDGAVDSLASDVEPG